MVAHLVPHAAHSVQTYPEVVVLVVRAIVAHNIWMVKLAENVDLASYVLEVLVVLVQRENLDRYELLGRNVAALRVCVCVCVRVCVRACMCVCMCFAIRRGVRTYDKHTQTTKLYLVDGAVRAAAKLLKELKEQRGILSRKVRRVSSHDVVRFF